MRLLTLARVVLIAPPAGATNLPQSKEQQKCLAGFSKGTAGIAKLVSKGATGCIKQAAAGKVADAQACFEADPKGKLDKSLEKFLSSDRKLCNASAPDFGRTSPANASMVAR